VILLRSFSAAALSGFAVTRIPDLALLVVRVRHAPGWLRRSLPVGGATFGYAATAVAARASASRRAFRAQGKSSPTDVAEIPKLSLPIVAVLRASARPLGWARDLRTGATA
jgi:hypothetical protein